MKREFHVRICESVGVRFPRATRPDPARIIFHQTQSYLVGIPVLSQTD